MTQKMRSIPRKLLSFMLKRIPMGSVHKREVLSRALEELEEVAHYRLQAAGFSPNGIVDVGAHMGDWTRSISCVFPNVPILMVEARKEQRPALEQVRAEVPNVDFAVALLAANSGIKIPFHIQSTGSSMFLQRSNVPHTVEQLQTVTLDELARYDVRLKEPLFLKLDVQGAEIEVLRGAKHILSCTEVAQLEVALLHYNEGAPTAADVVKFMDEAGFAIFDVAELARTNGVDLAQMDLIFVRKGSLLRRNFFLF